MSEVMEGVSMPLFCFSVLLIIAASTAADTITTNQSVRYGETIVSAGGTFELGYFSPSNSSTKRYLGIWYKKISIKTVVWVANREIPLAANSSAALKVTSQGILVLVQDGSKIWTSNSSHYARNPVAQLLDSGNLIVKDAGDDNPEHYLWQSFDYPGNTLLAGMKLGMNIISGFNRFLSSWKSPEDPSQGNWRYGFEAGGCPEIVLRKDSVETYRAGLWNILRFSGTPEFTQNSVYTFGVNFTDEEIYYRYELVNSSIPSIVVIEQSGYIQRFTWVDKTSSWNAFVRTQIDDCDSYALCGAYGRCNISNIPKCGCLEAFRPVDQMEWDRTDYSSCCVRKNPVNCSGDGFRKYSGVKLPETRKSWFNRLMNLDDCRRKCLSNCSCTAYTSLDIRGGGTGCVLWFGELIDIRLLNENGQDIHVRMAASDSDSEDDAESNLNKQTIIILTVMLSTGMVLLLLGLVLVLYFRKRKQQKQRELLGISRRSAENESQKEDLELRLFNFSTIANATNNFSTSNKLGQGGFGPVYKGVLKDGQEIAVKRLSKNSTQGLIEFKNEVVHIAKLQHRNLVKLLGCCIEEEETMLIYEFMPNKSLDFFIFDNLTDQTRRNLLDWPQRYHIINGIARGLLYLHQDSRLRIIHRDLKASNVLLDYEMNAKISDFGMARSFGGNETEATTIKVVGTYGYMSPEYATDGVYSVKSDVFSFGVTVLEIVSGKRNRGFCHEEHRLNLLGHAWRLYKEGRSLELVATSLKEPCKRSEALRSIQLGLLCVQRSPENRPSMSSVVVMLSGESALPEPKEPGFFTERDLVDTNSSSGTQRPCSSNDFTISELEAR